MPEADGRTARLILVTGHAGTGKSTLARRLVRGLAATTGERLCLLDKDTLYGEFSSRVMGLLTGDPDDRDSPTYLDNLRDAEYDGLLAVARENLAVGTGVVVCGPLSREVRAHRLTADALGLPAGTPVHNVWVSVPEAVARARIVARADHRDRYKLQHWDEYRVRRFEPAPADYPELTVFDNSAPGFAGIDALIARLARP